MERGAQISDCKKYRYRLWRIWNEAKPNLAFIMLNPSTANEMEDDPTVQRCRERADRLGYGGLEIINLFAFRTTDPEALYRQADPIGPENDEYIRFVLKRSPTVICAWGKHGQLNQRAGDVAQLIRQSGSKPMALKINKDGSPAHPLYVGYNAPPQEFDFQPIAFRKAVA